jgi:hypothetical protein
MVQCPNRVFEVLEHVVCHDEVDRFVGEAREASAVVDHVDVTTVFALP